MKYFFISDVHGCYDKMLTALTDAGFNRDQDTLVSVGDLFDRGPQSKEVLEYIMNCPHKIIIVGNHDWRLRQLILRPYLFDEYDVWNGVPATLTSLNDRPLDDNTMYIDLLIALEHNALLTEYFHQCNYAIEFQNLIITHAWVPYNDNKTTHKFESWSAQGYPSDWREAPKWAWWDAVWANTDKCITDHIYPDKTLLIGHWHAWRLAQKFGEKRMFNKKQHEKYEYINCDTYIHDKFIAIDGCSNYPNGGKVNVYVYETDEEPTLYPYQF